MRILVVQDDTETSVAIAERLGLEIGRAGLEAVVRTLDIERVPGVRLQSREDIKEYVGKPEHLAGAIGDTEILVVHLAPVDAATIAAARDLRLVACARSAPANVDTAAAAARGIPVAFCPGRNARAVAEFALGLMLAASRGIAGWDAEAKGGRWQVKMDRYAFLGPELMGKTLGVIGFGSIGRAVAKLALAFEMEVLAFDPASGLATVPGVEMTGMRELLARSDFVSLHARQASDAPPLLGEAELGLMKKGAILVNTARGELVDEGALARAIEAGALGGAALDVLREEPPAPDHPLLKLRKVIVTPHVAGISSDISAWSSKLVVGEILRFLRGEPLLNATPAGGRPAGRAG